MKHMNVVAALLGSLFCACAGAQSLSGGLGLVVYPSSGQAADQQARDEGECYQWANTTTGIDPANPLAGVQLQTAAGAAPPPGASAAAGAARGAAGAALIGELADEDKSEFAAAGAVIGAARGARRAKQQQAAAQQQASAGNDAQAQQRRQLFANAFGACMEGRKYTVK